MTHTVFHLPLISGLWGGGGSLRPPLGGLLLLHNAILQVFSGAVGPLPFGSGGTGEVEEDLHAVSAP